MTITEHISRERLEVRLGGTLNHTIGAACERAIRHAHALGVKQVHFNLSGITNIEHVNLGTLCFALHTIRQLGMDCTVTNPPTMLENMLAKLEP